ncbi:hypothetical protein BJ138DRAFT_1115901 [Hygrophoropsis aurantiaca]|uniref:Uncharacterized protein n=1 Tax=Hygrophoropsis aurantiaca TaxID=72124 RepID=A0ACB8A5R0_9AGAM|nr:hypothetical protein BJ138DRAFT_1115901 [Hygrophoropsis aurantiaca]
MAILSMSQAPLNAITDTRVRDSFRLVPLSTQTLEGDSEDEVLELLDHPTPLHPLTQPSASASLPPKPPLPRSSGKKEHQRAGKKAKRARKRQLEDQGDPGAGKMRSRLSKKYATPFAVTIKFNAISLRAAKSAFVGARQRIREHHDRQWHLQELFDRGFDLIPWDGKTTHAIVDSEERIVSILAGRPHDPTWDDVVADATSALHEAGLLADVPKNNRQHSRGDYPTIAVGVSYGNGQMVPGNLKHTAHNETVVAALLANKSIQRIAGFANSALKFYAPKLFRFYADHVNPLFNHYPQLRRNFINSIFPAATFNCGPRVVDLEHVDSTNVPYGLCPIWAGGQFDPRLGGHLILFEFKLVIEFPPGSTVLIPSGTVRHGNVPIQQGETRYSFTQYCPGSLVRWVQYGYQSAKACSAEGKAKLIGKPEDYWKWAIGLFSKLSELQQDRTQVFKS